ncbi:MAG: FecR domain-containing protein [Syntrophobacteraceae bacterium]
MTKVVSVQGKVMARKAGETKWISVQLDDTYCAGDTIRAPERSRAALLLRNESLLRIDQNTTVTLVGVESERHSILEMLNGAVLFFNRFPAGLTVNTPFVNAYVEGTEFLVRVQGRRALVTVYEGRVSASNNMGSIVLEKGQTAEAGSGQPPTLRAISRPRDAVQWALYYPPIPDYRLESLSAERNGWRTSVLESLDLYRRGDLSGAFDAIQRVPTVDDPAFYSYRALLLLTVGRVDEASADLARAIELNLQDSYAFALRAVIAVAQNRKEQALELAKKAVDYDPSSSAALVALSYAQQASFDLKDALKSVQQAVSVNPSDAHAWARLAELQLSFGYTDRALDAARRAISIDPHLSRTQTVLGYAYLSQIRTAEAKKAFQKAISFDSADPLPRLGMGLAVIRDGDLVEGRRQIEIAAILDPDNSLIRSYLGKAYFEEKRDKQAANQLDQAKELDPMDPTPWFYDAIRKQTVNRPAEALEDLQKSIRLNDNRAVYRSRLLLDEDLAARSVSLGRIYDDLGFQWLSVTEGSRSLSKDPANFSAHRFLSDAFFSLPRHEIARVSELLQSQLLQPLNIMPIQPQLAESKLFPLSGPGLRDPSFNEYTPLFNRNQLSLLTGFQVGERNTMADDVVHSGVIGRYSYSLGQFHFQTDGFVPNNDQKQNIYDGFLQVSLSPKTSVQTEFRRSDVKQGDLRLFFNPEFITIPQAETDITDMFRFGFHHSFAPGADLIGSFMRTTKAHHFSTPEPYDLDLNFTGHAMELQQLYRSDRFNVVGGIGYFNIEQRFITDFILRPVPGISRPIHRETHPNVEHTNLYLYSHLNFPDSVIWTLGVSADFFSGGLLDLNSQQPNPKFGVEWSPIPGTTLRGAIFRTFKRTLVTNQTVEPTQVAGFNQFFDDGEGTDAWRYGVGVDQKLTDQFFTGVEFSKREFTSPVSGFFTTGIDSADGNETLGRTYLYWLPHKWFAVGPEYQYELTKFGPELPGNTLSRLETHRTGLGLGFYHPSGFLARLRPSFVFQEGDFRLNPFDPLTKGDSNFFVLDATIGFRLPKRLGLIELVAKNLFDEGFRFQDTDPSNPQIAPRRLIMTRWSLSF